MSRRAVKGVGDGGGGEVTDGRMREVGGRLGEGVLVEIGGQRGGGGGSHRGKKRGKREVRKEEHV